MRNRAFFSQYTSYVFKRKKCSCFEFVNFVRIVIETDAFAIYVKILVRARL